MLMRYKEDWPEAKKRLEAWWRGEVLDRVCLQVTAPRKDYVPREISRPEEPEVRWTDPEYIIESNEETFQATFWGGEAFPCLHVDLGPGIMAAFLGCEPVFSEETVWQKSSIIDWNDCRGLEFDSQNRWWRLAKEITRQAVERGKDKYFVTITDLGGAVDVLSHLRGPENLCTDLVLNPGKVKHFRDVLTRLWFRLYDELYQIVQTEREGSSSWLKVWSRGKMYPVQCDFSNLISPEMFVEFCLPELREQAGWLDNTIYHLDGPGELKHLDFILSIPGIDVVQWVPLPDKRRKVQWMPLLKRIQEAGKGINLLVEPDEVEPIMAALSPKGLLLRTECASEEEAKELLKKVEKWSCRSG